MKKNSASMLLSLLFIAIYFIAVKPLLLFNMISSIVELTAAGILIVSLLLTAFAAIIILIIILATALYWRRKERIKPWLKKLKKQLTNIFAIILLITAVTLGTQWTAYTPLIAGENGKLLSGSISSLEAVTLGGTKQWISIRGKDINNPVLLFLAGGPGGTQLAATRNNLKALEDHFVVVNWEQPGAGKSYNSVPRNSITPERYINDAHTLTEYLCHRFDEDKIYVVGESWGSVLGIWLVQRYPERFHAFAGTGQMVDFKETEIIDYELAIKLAEEEGNTKLVEKLKKQGLPPYYGKDVTLKSATYLMYLSDYMTKNPSIHRPGYQTLTDMAGPEYGLYDKVNYGLGVLNTYNHVYPQLYDFDLRKQAVKLEVPVYILQGRHDINAPAVLVEEYFQKLQAPTKELIWFEHSGHSPWINERERFVNTLVNVALKDN